ncbi:maleylpyruvate isomerase family mycothiol-dependent enzyme [Dactylosporangium sp. CS-033363]|uniref:maleylpyruvate isomerase family mycothiol-dependent enzyme n=1 Tax=Dactylosporangium sp. CS-033363 TaxID=3239935 RepID=UPI003D9324E2
MDDVLGMIAAERRGIADLVSSLTPAQLATPSLCGDWTVRDVAGHLIAPLAGGSLALRYLVRSGFRLHTANARLARHMGARPPAEIAAVLRDKAEHPFRPPIVGFAGQLTDLQVHGQDMRRPLGLPHALEPSRLLVSLRFLVSGRAPGFVPKRGRIEGLRFETTDLDWTSGDGPPVRGPAEAVLLAICGRPAALQDLTGDGVALLRERISA